MKNCFNKFEERLSAAVRYRHHSRNPPGLAWDNVLSGNLTEEDEYLVLSTFINTEFFQSKKFTICHKIVLKFVLKAPQSEPEYSTKHVDAIASSGRTCVVSAAARGDESSSRTLLEYRADPNIPNIQGSTPLHHVRSVTSNELLIHHGAN